MAEHSTYPQRQCFRTNVEISFSSCKILKAGNWFSYSQKWSGMGVAWNIFPFNIFCVVDGISSRWMVWETLTINSQIVFLYVFASEFFITVFNSQNKRTKSLNWISRQPPFQSLTSTVLYEQRESDELVQLVCQYCATIVLGSIFTISKALVKFSEHKTINFEQITKQNSRKITADYFPPLFSLQKKKEELITNV